MRGFKKALPILIAFVVITGVIFLLFTKPQDPAVIPDDITSEVFTPTLSVNPQGVSEAILVKNATLQKPGFISAFKTMDKNMPDETNFAGVTGLLEGTHQNIEVPLTSPSVEGETYTLIIHVDDGDGIFEFPGDDQPSAFVDGTVNYVRTTIATSSATPIQN